MRVKFENRWKFENWGSAHKWEWDYCFSRTCFCPMYLITPKKSFIPFAFEIEKFKTERNFHFTILNFDWRIYKK